MHESTKITLEKTIQVKKAMADGKFKRVEDACKKLGISPASYYNYSKKVRLDDREGKGYHLPEAPISASNWSQEIEALRKENDSLRKTLEHQNVICTRLKLKLAESIISM